MPAKTKKGVKAVAANVPSMFANLDNALKKLEAQRLQRAGTAGGVKKPPTNVAGPKKNPVGRPKKKPATVAKKPVSKKPSTKKPPANSRARTSLSKKTGDRVLSKQESRYIEQRVKDEVTKRLKDKLEELRLKYGANAGKASAARKSAPPTKSKTEDEDRETEDSEEEGDKDDERSESDDSEKGDERSSSDSKSGSDCSGSESSSACSESSDTCTEKSSKDSDCCELMDPCSAMLGCEDERYASSGCDSDETASGYDSSDFEHKKRRAKKEKRLKNRNPEKLKRKLRRIIKKSRKKVPRDYIKRAYNTAKMAAHANTAEDANNIIAMRGLKLSITGSALRMWMALVLRILRAFKTYG